MLVKDCVFCKILRGGIPCTKVYEDDLVLAFLDIAPFNYGQVVIIPKEHQNSITTLPENLSARMIAVAPKIGVAQIRNLNADGFNLMLNNGAAAGQTVQHCHLHVIPRYTGDRVTMTAAPLAYDSLDAMRDVAEKLRQRLGETDETNAENGN